MIWIQVIRTSSRACLANTESYTLCCSISLSTSLVGFGGLLVCHLELQVLMLSTDEQIRTWKGFQCYKAFFVIEYIWVERIPFL